MENKRILRHAFAGARTHVSNIDAFSIPVRPYLADFEVGDKITINWNEIYSIITEGPQKEGIFVKCQVDSEEGEVFDTFVPISRLLPLRHFKDVNGKRRSSAIIKGFVVPLFAENVTDILNILGSNTQLKVVDSEEVERKIGDKTKKELIFTFERV